MIFITKKLKIGSEKVFKIAFKCLFITGIVLGVYLSLDVIFEIIDYTLVTLGLLNVISIIVILRKNKNLISCK